MFVEDSVVLRIGDVVGKRPAKPAQPRKITLSRDRAFRVTIEVVADLGDPTNAFVRLGYELDGVPVDQYVRLTLTDQPARWWFICPFSDIRVAKLYLPTGMRRFGSRTAHGLVYKCQIQPKRALQLSPQALRLLRRSKTRRRI
jgi:hypothetical protein